MKYVVMIEAEDGRHETAFQTAAGAQQELEQQIGRTLASWWLDGAQRRFVDDYGRVLSVAERPDGWEVGDDDLLGLQFDGGEPQLPSVFTFRSSGAAYDACQCYEQLSRQGTVFMIPGEQVVGLSWAWPVAVTKEHGQLHSPDGDDVDPVESFKFPLEDCVSAVRLAKSLGWDLHPAFERYGKL